MNPVELFTRFVEQERHLDIPGYQRDDLKAFVRYTPQEANREGFIQFNDLPPGREQVLVREQIDYFNQRQIPFEWKVYDLDRPANLKVRLEEEGFIANPSEVFLVLPISGSPKAPVPDPQELRIEVIQDEAGIADMIAVHQAVWPESSGTASMRFGYLLAAARQYTLYCAYWNGSPAGIAWICFPGESQFAGLFGGSVVPELRGHGIYSALLQTRLHEAWRRGYRYLTVDALPASRPILTKQGFQIICATHPMLHPFRPG